MTSAKTGPCQLWQIGVAYSVTQSRTLARWLGVVMCIQPMTFAVNVEYALAHVQLASICSSLAFHRSLVGLLWLAPRLFQFSCGRLALQFRSANAYRLIVGLARDCILRLIEGMSLDIVLLQ